MKKNFLHEGPHAIFVVMLSNQIAHPVLEGLSQANLPARLVGQKTLFLFSLTGG